MSEHPRPAHANGYPYACAARGDTHTRPAYLDAAPALSDRDTNPTTYRNAHGDGNAYPVFHCDTDATPACYRYGHAYASTYSSINAKPDSEASYGKRWC